MCDCFLYDSENFINLKYNANCNDIEHKKWWRTVFKKYRTYFRKRQSKILFICAGEIGAGHYAHCLPKRLLDVISESIGQKKIYCIVNNNNAANSFLSDHFLYNNILFCNYWEMHTFLHCQNMKKQPHYKIFHLKKDYLCSVNKLKILRLGILLELYQRNLWKNGYVNLLAHPTIAPQSFDYCFSDWQLDRLIDKTKAAEILSQLPFSYDISVSHNNLQKKWTNVRHHTQICNVDMTDKQQQFAKYFLSSYCSIVMETHDGICQPSDYFFTEKTARPVYWGHPFILLSTPGDLDRFKKQGYETFQNYCDESYDQEIDWKKRISKACDALQQLIKNKDLKMRDILKHNHNNLEHICNANLDHFTDILTS